MSLAECSAEFCSSRGQCSPETQPGGPVVCLCQEGYDGSHCQTLQCPEHCGGNGVCQEGSCRCFSGWEGPACNTNTTSSSSTETIETICPESFLQAQGKERPVLVTTIKELSLPQVSGWLSVARSVERRGNVWAESVSAPRAGLELTAPPGCATPAVLFTGPVRTGSVSATRAGAELTAHWTAAPRPARGRSTVSV